MPGLPMKFYQAEKVIRQRSVLIPACLTVTSRLNSKKTSKVDCHSTHFPYIKAPKLKRMRTLISVFAVLALLSCSNNASTEQKDDITKQRNLEGDELIKKGNYLVITGHCNDCHSPKVMSAMGPQVDSTSLLSGHPSAIPLPTITGDPTKPGGWIYMAPDITAFVGPWGISYAANLTPDSTTGIGAWSQETFVKTLRTGKHLGMDNGRPILPPMPWQEIAQMTDEDLGALYAYLRSLPPVKNKVTQPTPPNEVVTKK